MLGRLAALALTMTSAEKFFGSSQSKAHLSDSPENLRRTNEREQRRGSHEKWTSRTTDRFRRSLPSLPSCIAVYDFGSGFKVGVVRREERRIFGSPAGPMNAIRAEYEEYKVIHPVRH